MPAAGSQKFTPAIVTQINSRARLAEDYYAGNSRIGDQDAAVEQADRRQLLLSRQIVLRSAYDTQIRNRRIMPPRGTPLCRNPGSGRPNSRSQSK